MPGRDVELVTTVENMTTSEIQWEAIPGNNEGEEKVVINEKHPDKPITIGKHLPHASG